MEHNTNLNGSSRISTIFILVRVSSWVFPRNQNSWDSSDAYVTCIYRGVGLSIKINMCEKSHGENSAGMWMQIAFCFCKCSQQMPQNSPLELRGWHRHYIIISILLLVTKGYFRNGNFCEINQFKTQKYSCTKYISESLLLPLISTNKNRKVNFFLL